MIDLPACSQYCWLHCSVLPVSNPIQTNLLLACFPDYPRRVGLSVSPASKEKIVYLDSDFGCGKVRSVSFCLPLFVVGLGEWLEDSVSETSRSKNAFAISFLLKGLAILMLNGLSHSLMKVVGLGDAEQHTMTVTCWASIRQRLWLIWHERP